MSTEASAPESPLSPEVLEENVRQAARRNGPDPMHRNTKPAVEKLAEYYTFTKVMSAGQIADAMTLLRLTVTRNAVVGWWKRWYKDQGRPIPQSNRAVSQRIASRKVNTAPKAPKKPGARTFDSHFNAERRDLKTPHKAAETKVVKLEVASQETAPPTTIKSAKPTKSSEPSARRRLEDRLIDIEYKRMTSVLSL